ncbi:MAG TPA: hypothetical protein VHK24_00410 [Steroidobacter sp.]|jgi:hypothetical protein|nr:hypothetical protein [Steroidobacter sp.]
MNRYPNTQLMTIEEAQRLSDPRTSAEAEAEAERCRIWAWQTVEGLLAQTITDEQIERMEKLARG